MRLVYQDVSLLSGVLGKSERHELCYLPQSLTANSHTPWAGAANINGGVTIDTQSLNQVTVSSDQSYVSIGPGNRWGNVYPTLDDINKVMVGGRLSHVGVGGLVIGGTFEEDPSPSDPCIKLSVSYGIRSLDYTFGSSEEGYQTRALGFNPRDCLIFNVLTFSRWNILLLWPIRLCL